MLGVGAMDWNSVAEKIVVAVIGGAILGGGAWLLSRIISSENQPVEAGIRWVEIPSPFARISNQQLAHLNTL
jgi:hypothetical protein